MAVNVERTLTLANRTLVVNCMWTVLTGITKGLDKPLDKEISVGKRADEVIQVECLHMFAFIGPNRYRLPGPGDGAHQGEGG